MASDDCFDAVEVCFEAEEGCLEVYCDSQADALETSVTAGRSVHSL